MQYVLGFLFRFKYYKNKANFKIYLNDTLIDDFDLDSDIDTKNVTTYNKDFGDKDTIRLENRVLPKRLFSYTVDGSAVKNNLKIVVENNNTNYTNGFMTEYSYFQWHSIFLIPKNLISHKEYGRARKLVHRYKKMMNIGQDLIGQGLDPGKAPFRSFTWPIVSQKVEDRELTNDIKLDQLGHYKMGGSYTLEFEIHEHKNIPKFKMLVPKDYKKLHSLSHRSLAVTDYFPLIADNFKLLNTHNEDK